MGFVEGRNLRIESAWANDRNDQLPSIAAEFVRRSVDIIVVSSTASLLAAKGATQTIPIVFQIGSDPVEIGVVASLSRPGGNMTGVYNLQLAVTAKRLELLHEIVPKAMSIAYLRNPTNPVFAEAEERELRTAARILGVGLVPVNAGNSAEFEAAFATFVGAGSTAVLVSSDALFSNYPDALVALASRYKVSAMYDRREFATAGGLLSYGLDFNDILHSLGIYAGRILKGDNPADLPVQQSTKVELIINLKTAKALGLTIPLPLLGRADEVIE
jgi:putative ABC transport system substrate-binding protein